MPIEVEVPEVGRRRLQALQGQARELARAKEQADRELAAYLGGILVGLGIDEGRLIGLEGDRIVVAEE